MNDQDKYKRRILCEDEELMTLGDVLGKFQLMQTQLPKTKRRWFKQRVNPVWEEVTANYVKAKREFWTKAKHLHPELEIGEWYYDFGIGVFFYDTDDTKA